MKSQHIVKQKIRGRPKKEQSQTVFVGVRLLPNEASKLDAIRNQAGENRSAAIRRLIKQG